MQHHANSDDPVSHQVAQNATKGDPATIAPPLPERPAMARAGESYRKMAGLARRTVREAHRCGRLLQTAKAELPHGGWLPALAAEGIPVRTAQRCMTLAERFPTYDKLTHSGAWPMRWHSTVPKKGVSLRKRAGWARQRRGTGRYADFLGDR